MADEERVTISDQPDLPDLSVAIINWKTPHETLACVRSVQETAEGLDLEILIIDNASGDGSAELLRQGLPRLRLIENPENWGFARAANQATRETTAPFLLLLNPDVRAHPGALRALLDYARDHPRAGIMGPRLRWPDGRVQYSCRRFPTPWAALFRGTPLAKIFRNNRFSRNYLMADWDHTTPRTVDWLAGAVLLLRRAAVEALGGFDEGFFMYCEDVDLCYRAGQAGWEVHYVPPAVFQHSVGKSSDHAQAAMIRHHHESMYRYWKKHLKPRTFWLLRPIYPLGIGFRHLCVWLRFKILFWRHCRIGGSREV